MTSFLGFKLKGSSALELKTDLCILWNEQGLSLSTQAFFTPAVTPKQKELKNYGGWAECTDL